MFSTRELIRRAARTLLAHRDAQRGVDPHSVEWAETVLRQNPSEPAEQLAQPMTEPDRRPS